MPSKHWHPRKHDTGLPEINTEHQVLILIANRLIEQASTKTLPDLLDSTFKDFEHYLALHFAHEERLMRLGDYPKIETHVREHQSVLEKVQKYRAEAQKQKPLGPEFFAWLTEWIQSQLNAEDYEYVAYLGRKAA